jgi:hypothetical protein
MQARTAARRVPADGYELGFKTDILHQRLKLGTTQIRAYFENDERRVGTRGFLLECANRIGARLRIVLHDERQACNHARTGLARRRQLRPPWPRIFVAVGRRHQAEGLGIACTGMYHCGSGRITFHLGQRAEIGAREIAIVRDLFASEDVDLRRTSGHRRANFAPYPNE